MLIMGSKTWRRSLCLLGLEAAGHITLTLGRRDLLAMGAAWTAPGGRNHQRVRDQRQRLSVLCATQGMEGTE